VAKLAVRQGRWKYIAPGKGPRIQQTTNTELGNDPEPQLYDVSSDPGERKNLAAERPGKVRELAALLEKIRTGAKPAATGRANRPQDDDAR
jgi:arylsulfatase A-like enzyme